MNPVGTINRAVGVGAQVGALGMAGNMIDNQVKRTQRKVSKGSTYSKRKSNTKGRGRK